MKPKELIDRVWQSPTCTELTKQIKEKGTAKLIGVSGSLLPFLVTRAAVASSGVQLVVLHDREAASYFYNDCFNLIAAAECGTGSEVLLFPTAHKLSLIHKREEPAGLVQRTAVLSALENLGGSSLIVCTYAEALAEVVVERGNLSRLSFTLSVGQKISIEFLEQTLAEYGFQRVDFVAEPGQYSVRGGILDMFSYADSKPYRIDFFGDTIDSIRLFAVSTQLSSQRFDSVMVIANLQGQGDENRVPLTEYITNCAAGQNTVWWDNPTFALSRVDQLRVKQLADLQEPSKIDTLLTSAKQLQDTTQGWGWVSLSSFDGRVPDRVIDFKTTPQGTFNKKFELLIADVQRNSDSRITTYILTENLAQVERLENIFHSIDPDMVGWGHISLTLSGGFVWPELGLALYTDHQIFDRYLRYKIHNEIDRGDSLTMQEIASLSIGDYVVHVDHGVGRFGGLVRSTEGGTQREFIKLMYKDNDVLFVNLHSLHRISKYKDKEATPPKINKLGSGAWQKLKATTKSKVKDIARELIALYAKRKASQGFAFSPDSYLQTELEASFLYEDTPDQHTTTEAIKLDMESAVPMDRLVCGDVGFGKTEIAMRAAFKAVTDGKQVAVLVPTTILSLQHYRTFSKRLKNFPVRVENFSRVKSTKQTHEILDDLKKGAVDIIIGTHKLLGKTVEFKDLGLLVVDEEQKFGVTNKEKLRHLKSNVDTLTLTATPIPRTLQFSLMGARDMSIINTPPPNRQAVSTEVLEYDEAIIQEAVMNEVERGGQVFFLHNRVENIHRVAATIERLCPKARCVVGHGQMDATELEKVMMDFIYGTYDVLIATTIIESGIDIPNANTIIINNAQNFGLSDLHQLRGRVGRTNRKAYCYLLIPSFEALTSDAARRLKAIEEFSDLGSGFNIAMQDLDIRGAGNILGAEQSGFIADIGYQTYQQIMAEAVNELREEQGLEVDTQTIDCIVETDRTAFLPDSYIGSTSEKLRLYRQLDDIRTPEQLDRYIAVLKDRFGEPPKAATELFEILMLRRAAQRAGFDKVTLNKRVATLYFAAAPQGAYYGGATFQRILQKVVTEQKRYAMKEGGSRLSMTIFRIIEIRDLIEILDEFTQSQP